MLRNAGGYCSECRHMRFEKPGRHKSMREKVDEGSRGLRWIELSEKLWSGPVRLVGRLNLVVVVAKEVMKSRC
jgi:hypothetical protein